MYFNFCNKKDAVVSVYVAWFVNFLLRSFFVEIFIFLCYNYISGIVSKNNEVRKGVE